MCDYANPETDFGFCICGGTRELALLSKHGGPVCGPLPIVSVDLQVQSLELAGLRRDKANDTLVLSIMRPWDFARVDELHVPLISNASQVSVLGV